MSKYCIEERLQKIEDTSQESGLLTEDHNTSRSLFNSNPFLFTPLLYPSPLAPLLLQPESSFHLYQEVFLRNLIGHYTQTQLPPPLPLPSLHLPSSTRLSPVSPENEPQVSFTRKKFSREKCPKTRRRLSCPQCSYTTNRLNNLKRHVQTMHEILSKPIDCCEQLFTSKAHFRAHVNIEHRCGYHCDICRRTFCRKALLRRHQSIHSGQKAFVCSICSYSTSHKGNLDRHTRIHRHHNEHKELSV